MYIPLYQKRVIKTHTLLVYDFPAFKSFLHHIYDKLFNDLPNTMKFRRLIIAVLNEKSLKHINKCSGT